MVHERNEVPPDGTRGYLALVLHAHLPFVREPGGETSAEERWLFEAITESYLPLLDSLSRLARDRVAYRVALSVSPPLLNMLTDPLVQARYVRHVDTMLDFVEHELERTRESPPFHRLAGFYRERLRGARRAFVETWSRDLVSAFRKLQDEGHLETLACAATHAYLPLLAADTSSVRAQIRVGMAEHRRSFGRDAAGFWLPEAAFVPGLEHVLADHGVRYVIVDTHGLARARPRPVLGVWTPIVTPAGVAVFGRDGESSAQVWSATEGYPADVDYRDFHRDAGFELGREDLRSLLPAGGERIATGVKYHRITGRSPEKEPYVVERALRKAEAHAGNFVASRERQIQWLADTMRQPPIVVAPYDAELFGHWWYEGPQWLEAAIRKIAYDQRSFVLATPSDYLARHPIAQEAIPAGSSWGAGGHHTTWLGGENDWIYRPLHRAGRRMAELAGRHEHATGLLLRALNQAARELLLAQSSDWAFMMSRGTFVNYAVQRTRAHLARFARLAREVETGVPDERWLADVEARDNLFPALDYRVFR